MSRPKKQIRPQLSKYRFQSESGKRKYRRGLISNPKVNGDKFILDGLVYVARLGSASLKIVQDKKRDKETLEKLILHNIVRPFASGDAKVLE